MNRTSPESAKRWEKLGLFQDSEFVWIKYKVRSRNRNLYWQKPFTEWRGSSEYSPYQYKVIGPAPHCEEMGDYLWGKRVKVQRNFIVFYFQHF